MSSVYHEVRLPHDPARVVLWRALWRYYFSQFVRPDDCVLDIGCGHGAFINSVVARKRIGARFLARLSELFAGGG